MTHLLSEFRGRFKRKNKSKKQRLRRIEKEERQCEKLKAPGSVNKFSSERDRRAFEDKHRCNVRDFEEEKFIARKGKMKPSG